MKKRIVSLFLCTLLLCSLTLPSDAISGLTKEEVKAMMIDHRDHCTDRESCPHVDMYYNSFGPTDNQPLHDHLSNEEKVAIKAYVKEISTGQISPTCPHNRAVSLTNLDTETTIIYCRDCSSILGDTVAATVTTTYRTASVFASGCQHNFGDWSYFDINQHIHFCENSGCDFYEFAAHNTTPANCTTDEHCVDCGSRHSSWETAWGHSMEYIADDFLFGTTHSYRCGRRDNDAQLICDYVAYTEPCVYSQYCDPESGGTHDVYDICSLCGNWSEIQTVPCTAVNGGFCWYCTNGISWTP